MPVCLVSWLPPPPPCACCLTGLFTWGWHTGNCCGFTSWNYCTIFCCGSFIECFLFGSKAHWPRCIWMAACQVVQSLSYSSSTSFISSLQSEWEDLRQAPSTFCPSLSLSDTLFAFSLHCCVSFPSSLSPKLFLYHSACFKVTCQYFELDWWCSDAVFM